MLTFSERPHSDFKRAAFWTPLTSGINTGENSHEGIRVKDIFQFALEKAIILIKSINICMTLISPLSYRSIVVCCFHVLPLVVTTKNRSFYGNAPDVLVVGARCHIGKYENYKCADAMGRNCRRLLTQITG